MRHASLGEQLRALFRPVHEIDEAMQASLSSLAADPVLASAVHRIGDGGDTDDPDVQEMAQRVVAAGRG